MQSRDIPTFRDAVLKLALMKRVTVNDLEIQTQPRTPIDRKRRVKLDRHPGRLPAFVTSRLADEIFRYTYSDVRKMWPYLSRKFNLPEKKPAHDLVTSLWLDLLSIPYAGPMMLDCAITAGVARPIISLSRSKGGICIAAELLPMLRTPTHEVLGSYIATALFANAWFLWEFPAVSQYPDIYQAGMGASAQTDLLNGEYPGDDLGSVFAYLDWLQTLEVSAAEPSLATSVSEIKSEAVPTPNMPSPGLSTSNAPKVVYDLLLKRLIVQIDRISLAAREEIFDEITETVCHLRSTALFSQLVESEVTT